MQSALLTIAWFDFRRRLKALSTWVYVAMYIALAGLWMAAAGGAVGGSSVSFGGDKIFINGPQALAMSIAVLGFTAVTVIGSICGRGCNRTTKPASTRSSSAHRSARPRTSSAACSART